MKKAAFEVMAAMGGTEEGRVELKKGGVMMEVVEILKKREGEVELWCLK